MFVEWEMEWLDFPYALIVRTETEVSSHPNHDPQIYKEKEALSPTSENFIDDSAIVDIQAQ